MGQTFLGESSGPGTMETFIISSPKSLQRSVPLCLPRLEVLTKICKFAVEEHLCNSVTMGLLLLLFFQFGME